MVVRDRLLCFVNAQLPQLLFRKLAAFVDLGGDAFEDAGLYMLLDVEMRNRPVDEYGDVAGGVLQVCF